MSSLHLDIGFHILLGKKKKADSWVIIKFLLKKFPLSEFLNVSTCLPPAYFSWQQKNMWGQISRMTATVGSNSNGEKSVLQIASPGTGTVVFSGGVKRVVPSQHWPPCARGRVHHCLRNEELPEQVLKAISDRCHSGLYWLQKELRLWRNLRHFATPNCNKGFWPAEEELL